MSLTFALPFRRRLGSRIHAAALRHLNRRFVAAPFDKDALVTQHWKQALADAGVELRRVIRVRPDTRGVFLVSHPEHGTCVLKTVFSTRYPQRAAATRALSEAIGRADTTIFPRVLSATADYTLEEYVDGQPFRTWLHQSFDEAAMAGFFESLKAWSTRAPSVAGSATLRPFEIREVCRAYLAKCLAHTRFPGNARRVLKTVARLSRRGDALDTKIAWLSDAAERIVLPRGLMCGDMGNVNIVVHASASRVCVIDYETAGCGHRGFDCAYFISSLEKMGDDESALQSIDRKSVV